MLIHSSLGLATPQLGTGGPTGKPLAPFVIRQEEAPGLTWRNGPRGGSTTEAKNYLPQDAPCNATKMLLIQGAVVAIHPVGSGAVVSSMEKGSW